MAALPVVQRDVDALVDDVLDQLPVLELGSRRGSETLRGVRTNGGHRAAPDPAETSSPVRSSFARDSATRSRALVRFSREFA